MDLQIESAYEASKYEDSIYKKWLDGGLFTPKVDRSKESFMVPMPPPNATGVLHLGHATMLALEDIMCRFERMRGKEVLWLPGTDHAAIATQSVVERKLVEEGVESPRKALGREKLIDEIKDFVEKSKSSIRNQVKKMGSSCDWTREKYTLDEDMNIAVNTLFERMHEDGLIYRGGRIVNWDPNMQTTVADDELEHVEEKAKFYYFQYGPVVIGTARPETKLLDKIVVVHPDDERYQDLIGKEFEVEWIEGTIKAKVVADECMDMEMGTGAMTITPAHSFVDFELSEKYDLDVEQIIDFEGKILEDVSEKFGGMTIAEAREAIVKTLDEKGLLVKVEEGYEHQIPVNYRGKGVIEPQVMKQWFIDVNKKVIDWKGKKMSIKEVLQDTVRSKMIELVPERFEKTYFHWIDNLKDWCISRQIWWGHQIPVWYKVSQEQYDAFHAQNDVSSLNLELLGVDGETFVGDEKPADGLWLRDPDTLDTWFSSALWTFATLGWPEKTEELDFFHPSAVLETGYDILFFWVARMILASTYALRRDGLPEEKCLPFKTVYLHGLIKDRNGKKMSKSRPETCIDPLEMIDKYGADALRLSLMIGSTPGNDMRLYEEKIAGYRNFINKIWNGSRFALMNVSKEDLKAKFDPKDVETLADKWIMTRLQELIGEVTEDLEGHRYSDAGNKIYEFFWKQYCDWYLEMSKGSVNAAVLIYVLETTLKLMHPFVPFVSEKLWEFMEKDGDLIASEWPAADTALVFDEEASDMDDVHARIEALRSWRASQGVKFKTELEVTMDSGLERELIEKMTNFKVNVDQAGERIVFGDLPEAEGLSDQQIAQVEKQIVKQKEKIAYLEGMLKNPGFVNSAPEAVIDKKKEMLEKEVQALALLEGKLA